MYFKGLHFKKLFVIFSRVPIICPKWSSPLTNLGAVVQTELNVIVFCALKTRTR